MDSELFKIPCEKFFRFLFFKKGTVLTEKATFFQKGFAPRPLKRIKEEKKMGKIRKRIDRKKGGGYSKYNNIFFRRNEKMKVGFGRIDVTPPIGVPLAGYFEPRTMVGVFDPLQLNAVVVEVGEDRLAIITADFLSMRETDCTGLRRLIEKETGIPAQNILTQCLHQHTSIFAGNSSGMPPYYKQSMERKYVDVVKYALDDLAEATVTVSEKETARPVSFIRRFRMKDGSVRTNPGFGNPDIDHPLGDADNTVRLVRFHREGKGDIAMVGFQTHPDTIGGCRVSADWPGWVRRLTEKALEEEGVSCILVNGCQGDTNHFNVKGERPPKDHYEKFTKVSKGIAEEIVKVALALWNEGKESPEGAISGEVTIHSIPTNLNGIDRIEEAKALHKKVTAGEPTGLNMAEKGEVRRIAGMENHTLFQKVPVTMVAFGKIAVVGYGGEPFTEYADVLREAYPEMTILTACNCNGAQGYLPSEKAFEEGGYEARTTVFTPSTPTVLQGEAKAKLARHIEKL